MKRSKRFARVRATGGSHLKRAFQTGIHFLKLGLGKPPKDNTIRDEYTARVDVLYGNQTVAFVSSLPADPPLLDTRIDTSRLSEMLASLLYWDHDPYFEPDAGVRTGIPPLVVSAEVDKTYIAPESSIGIDKISEVAATEDSDRYVEPEDNVGPATLPEVVAAEEDDVSYIEHGDNIGPTVLPVVISTEDNDSYIEPDNNVGPATLPVVMAAEDDDVSYIEPENNVGPATLSVAMSAEDNESYVEPEDNLGPATLPAVVAAEDHDPTAVEDLAAIESVEHARDNGPELNEAELLVGPTQSAFSGSTTSSFELASLPEEMVQPQQHDNVHVESAEAKSILNSKSTPRKSSEDNDVEIFGLTSGILNPVNEPRCALGPTNSENHKKSSSALVSKSIYRTQSRFFPTCSQPSSGRCTHDLESVSDSTQKIHDSKQSDSSPPEDAQFVSFSNLERMKTSKVVTSHANEHTNAWFPIEEPEVKVFDKIKPFKVKTIKVADMLEIMVGEEPRDNFDLNGCFVTHPNYQGPVCAVTPHAPIQERFSHLINDRDELDRREAQWATYPYKTEERPERLMGGYDTLFKDFFQRDEQPWKPSAPRDFRSKFEIWNKKTTETGLHEKLARCHWCRDIFIDPEKWKNKPHPLDCMEPVSLAETPVPDWLMRRSQIPKPVVTSWYREYFFRMTERWPSRFVSAYPSENPDPNGCVLPIFGSRDSTARQGTSGDAGRPRTRRRNVEGEIQQMTSGVAVSGELSSQSWLPHQEELAGHMRSPPQVLEQTLNRQTTPPVVAPQPSFSRYGDRKSRPVMPAVVALPPNLLSLQPPRNAPKQNSSQAGEPRVAVSQNTVNPSNNAAAHYTIPGVAPLPAPPR